jgi:hypothetical protein
MDTVTLLRSRMVNKIWKSGVEEYIKLFMNINTLLRPFFPTAKHVLQFCWIQCASKAWITSVLALQLFIRRRVTQTYLLLYIESSDAQLMIRFLESAGYTFRPAEGQGEDAIRALESRISPHNFSLIRHRLLFTRPFAAGNTQQATTIDLVIPRFGKLATLLKRSSSMSYLQQRVED